MAANNALSLPMRVCQSALHSVFIKPVLMTLWPVLLPARLTLLLAAWVVGSVAAVLSYLGYPVTGVGLRNPAETKALERFQRICSQQRQEIEELRDQLAVAEADRATLMNKYRQTKATNRSLRMSLQEAEASARGRPSLVHGKAGGLHPLGSATSSQLDTVGEEYDLRGGKRAPCARAQSLRYSNSPASIMPAEGYYEKAQLPFPGTEEELTWQGSDMASVAERGKGAAAGRSSSDGKADGAPAPSSRLGSVAWGTHVSMVAVAIALQRVYDVHHDLTQAVAAARGAAAAAASMGGQVMGFESYPILLNSSSQGRSVLWWPGTGGRGGHPGGGMMYGGAPGYGGHGGGPAPGSTSTNSWLAWIVVIAYILWLLRVLPATRSMACILQASAWALVGVLWHTLMLAQHHQLAV